MTRSRALAPGVWLGIDVGSSKKKIATFCAIDSSDRGITVAFEQGSAAAPYPSSNTRAEMLDPARSTYLRAEVEDAIAELVSRSVLLGRCRDRVGEVPVTVAIDAPVGFAAEGRTRATERASSQSFATPTRERFERDLEEKTKEGFFRSVVYWKCVGFALYRQCATILGADEPSPSLETLASRTVGEGDGEREWRLREVFPSDVYKRANGTDGILAAEPRQVLARLVEAPWQAAEAGAIHSKQTHTRLKGWRNRVARELESGERLAAFSKAGGVFGDLVDAFTGAFTACCEDHGGACLHGAGDGETLRREGAILTVTTRTEIP
ncbi:MAG: DUF429 domain-containing protein [Holophagales bacterium]|nr:DUF429 domain-containing protein [Holophagales bacterium]